MSDRDWEKELARIDKRLESMSDDELLDAAGRERTGPPAQDPAAVSAGATDSRPAGAIPPGRGLDATVKRAGPPSTGGVAVRVGLATALAIGVSVWPYGALCGLGLFAYLGAVTVVLVAGGWAAIASWRARNPYAHVLTLLVIFWGLVLVLAEVLPRTGQARDEARTAWLCT